MIRFPRRLCRALATLTGQLSLPGHAFWTEDISLADATIFDLERIIGPRQIADVYLLARAVKHGGRLVTCDTAIPLAAVRGAGASNLVVV